MYWSLLCYIFEDFESTALWDKDSLAEFAADVPGVGKSNCHVILRFLAQLETYVALRNFYHF